MKKYRSRIGDASRYCTLNGCKNDSPKLMKGSAITLNATLVEKAVRSYERAGFVSVTDVIPDALLEIRYYSAFNFVGRRIDSYNAPVAYLTREAAYALKRVSDAVKELGYVIEIFDAYRPQSAVEHFKRWAQDLTATEMKPYFYPDIDKADLFELGYVAERSAHSRGSAVDLTLVDMRSGQALDMGSAFDFFGEVSHSAYTCGLTERQISNRAILRRVMTENGFKPIAEEWWHFCLENEPYPNTYFDFPITLPAAADGEF